MTKKCTKCNTKRGIEFFYKNKLTKDGLQFHCKLCNKDYNKNNKEKISKKASEKYQINKEFKLLKNKEWRERNKEKRHDYMKSYLEKNKENIKKSRKKHYENNKERLKKDKEKYYEKNKDNILIRQKERYNKIKSNSEFKKKRNDYEKKKLDSDKKFRFVKSLRSNIRNCFKRGGNNFKKTTKTESILGCKINDFILYIESKFANGMTFDNYGKWHIDHIIPISTAITEEEVVKLNHYTNLQPLWANDNLKKSNKLNHESNKNTKISL